VNSLIRDLVEVAGLATATAGLTLLFGPVALVGAGLGVVVVLEVWDRG
jgi:hypothetical protein